MVNSNERLVCLYLSGRDVVVRGWKSTLEVKENGLWRPATTDEQKVIETEETAYTIFKDHIHGNDTALVTELIRLADNSSSNMLSRIRESYHTAMITNRYKTPSDWSLVACRNWLQEKMVLLPDRNPWTMIREEMLEIVCPDYDQKRPKERKVVDALTNEELLQKVVEMMDKAETDGLEDFRRLVRENYPRTPVEIKEWWRVSTYLLPKLHAIDEPVLANRYGQWWGRTRTGPSPLRDGVLQRIAASQLS